MIMIMMMIIVFARTYSVASQDRGTFCCEPPGEQHTNLWLACGFLGFLHYLVSAVSIFVCHDDFEQACVQRCHHNLDAP